MITIDPQKYSSSSYIRQIEKLLIDHYRAVVAERDPRAALLLDQKFAIQSQDGPTSRKRTIKNRRMADYIAFWNALTEEEQHTLSSHDAKINQMARAARTIATTEIVQAHNKVKATTAGSIDFVLRQFRAENIPASQVQKFLDENAVSWFSLTGHPTNPTTLEYTIAQTELARVLTNKSARLEDLRKALDVIYDTPVIGDRKTPLDEARETLNTLHVVYDTAVLQKNLFEQSLRHHGYAQEGVRINHPMIRPCAWTLGDGDGNESLTAEVLEEGIALHRREILGRYISDLKQLPPHPLLSRIEQALTAFSRAPDHADAVKAECLRLLGEALPCLAGSGAGTSEALLHEGLSNLAYLIKCFGLGFGTIDLRHNAADVTESAIALAAAAGFDSFENLKELEPDDLALRLNRWLRRRESLQKLQQVTDHDLLSAGYKIPAIILGRLQVIGRHPDMCEKFIIAETSHPAHALAALLLMKVTGNKVAEAGARIDLTVLSESVRDLMGLGNTLETLLENENFRGHVISRGRLIAMIAKSDTTRLDGRGEAEYMQYEACVDVYRVGAKMKRKYPALDDVLVSIMNGGGHALQRGGGRVTEIPAIHGRAAADARVTDCGPSTLTVQGQQLSILFCPGKVALGTLEALASHNLYTKAGIHGEMPDIQTSKSMNRQYARADAWLYAKTAGLAFDALAGENSAIDELLENAPWLSMKAGNVSSRPARRGEKPVGPGITPAEAKGKNPKALQGRAISGERLTAHACLPVFSVLGLLEAMETVRGQGQASLNPEKYGDPLHHLYRTHKIHRDGARATINAVLMADFDIAWPMLAGRSRPSRQEADMLANKFEYKDQAHINTPEITMAFLERYFLEAERLSYEMVSGQKARQNFKHGEGLKRLWPDLEREMSSRNRAAEFARVIEGYRNRCFNDLPDQPLSERQFRITQCLYASADVVNAPVGILATRTRLEPVAEIGDGRRTRFMRPESYIEEEVSNLLKLPSAFIRA